MGITSAVALAFLAFLCLLQSSAAHLITSSQSEQTQHRQNEMPSQQQFTIPHQNAREQHRIDPSIPTQRTPMILANLPQPQNQNQLFDLPTSPPQMQRSRPDLVTEEKAKNSNEIESAVKRISEKTPETQNYQNILTGIKAPEKSLEVMVENYHEVDAKMSHDKSKGLSEKLRIDQELQSDVVNLQEKTIYFRLVEILSHLVQSFHQDSDPNLTSLNPSSTLTPIDPLSQDNLSAVNANSPVEEMNRFNAAKSTVKSFDINQNDKIRSETRNLVRKRKKLYFIICIFSFGAASIMLIKLSEAKEKRKRDSRGGIREVPSEEYEIQQI